jgi:hypothetical protein
VAATGTVVGKSQQCVRRRKKVAVDKGIRGVWRERALIIDQTILSNT